MTEKYKYKSNYLFRFFMISSYIILIFFIAFDGLRNALIISKPLSYLREFVVFYTFLISFLCLMIAKRPLRIHKFFLVFVLLFLTFCLAIPSSISPYYPQLYSVTNPIILSYRTFQIFMLLVSFSMMEALTKKSYEYYFKWLLFFLFIYTLITPYLYFSPSNPILDPGWDRWWGRIGIGYPTMDGQTYAMAIILLLYALNISNKIYLNISFLLLVLGELLQVTGTGFVSLIFLSIFFSVISPRMSGLKRVFPSIFLAVVIVIAIVFLYHQELTQIFYLAQDKLLNIVGQGDNKSINARDAQLKGLFFYLDKSLFNIFFGLGNKIYVENQYSYIMIGFGVLGTIIFLFFIFSCLTYGFIHRRKDNYVMLLSTVIFSMTSYTLISFYLYPSYAFFALSISYSIKKITEYKKTGKLSKIEENSDD